MRGGLRDGVAEQLSVQGGGLDSVVCGLCTVVPRRDSFGPGVGGGWEPLDESRDGHP